MTGSIAFLQPFRQMPAWTVPPRDLPLPPGVEYGAITSLMPPL